jgi:hypothetical protein
MDPEGTPAHSAEARHEYIFAVVFFITCREGTEGKDLRKLCSRLEVGKPR